MITRGRQMTVVSSSCTGNDLNEGTLNSLIFAVMVVALFPFLNFPLQVINAVPRWLLDNSTTDGYLCLRVTLNKMNVQKTERARKLSASRVDSYRPILKLVRSPLAVARFAFLTP